MASAALYRLVWLLIALLPLLLFWSTGEWGAVAVLIACLAVASLFASLSGVAWMTWITEMVPESVRVASSSHQDMVAGAVGMVASLVAAQFIDRWQAVSSTPSQRLLGFSLLFGIGLAFGLWGLVGLRHIPVSLCRKIVGMHPSGGAKTPLQIRLSPLDYILHSLGICCGYWQSIL